MQSQALSVQIDALLSERLQKVASATQRTPLSLVLEALNQYVAINEWHLEATTNAAQAHAERITKIDAQRVHLCDTADLSTQSLAS
jgi:predicted transcriptional regulator